MPQHAVFTPLTRRRLGGAALGAAVHAASAGRAAAAPAAAAAPRSLSRPTAPAAPSSANPVLAWNAAALEAIRRTRTPPPIAARALAIVHTCVYDAWAAYDATASGSRLGDALRRPSGERTPENKAAAISHAAYLALVSLFPATQGLLDAQLRQGGYAPGLALADQRSPRGVAGLAVQAVLDYRRGDGANQFGAASVTATAPYADTSGYAPANTPDALADPNRWQPLRVPDGRGGTVVQKCVVPHWGRVAPFALDSGAQLRPSQPPPAYPSPAYREQAQQLLELSAGLTDPEKAIAEYWEDGPGTVTPPGHWNKIARAVSERDGHDLDADAVLFFVLNNAMLDASIAVWDCKIAVDYVRPISALRFLFKGQRVRAWGGPYAGIQTIDGGEWKPYQVATTVTPAFPEFVSGHSTFSAAAAEILARFTGSDVYGATYTRPARSSLIEPAATPDTDVTLVWSTFSEAAAQAGLSRRYGGIHFAGSDLAGRAMGRQVAALVWDRVASYLSGSAE